jgi:hypothetical protein
MSLWFQVTLDENGRGVHLGSIFPGFKVLLVPYEFLCSIGRHSSLADFRYSDPLRLSFPWISLLSGLYSVTPQKTRIATIRVKKLKGSSRRQEGTDTRIDPVPERPGPELAADIQGRESHCVIHSIRIRTTNRESGCDCYREPGRSGRRKIASPVIPFTCGKTSFRGVICMFENQNR